MHINKLAIWVTLTAAIGLFVIVSVGVSIRHARAFLLSENAALHINGIETYRNISFGGCHMYKIGESSHFRCEYRLDSFNKGSGNYEADYQNLVSGMSMDGYSGSYESAESVSGPKDINRLLGVGIWSKQGATAAQNNTLIATPFFQGHGITPAVTQGVYFSPSAPKAAMKSNRYIYGVTIRKSFIDIESPI